MKITKIVLFFVTISILMLSIQAGDVFPLTYQYTDPEVTVEFSETLEISLARHQQIADEIAGIMSNAIIDPTVASPNNIVCTIFGHKLSTTTVTATHHKVLPYDPRCLLEIYDVTACSRCDYTDAVLVHSTYILCCPVD